MFLQGFAAYADGSGYNVLVVVNQNSTNSIQLGNYYRARRNVPPQNFLRINWTGTNTEWMLSDFTNTLLNPVVSFVSTNGLTNQIQYVVLSMDIPYRINAGTNYYNSTTSALFEGFINDPAYETYVCELAANSSNAYVGSEGIYRATPPNAKSNNTNSWLATMITGPDLPTAEMCIQQGVAGDGTFPSQTVWLDKSSQYAYTVRFTEYDNTVFNSRLRTNYPVMRTNLDQPVFNSEIAGAQNGAYSFGTSPVPLFVPGALADNLSSYGGELFENTAGETTLLQFIASGASGSYGSVTEPCDYLQKFPDSQEFFYQSRGFSLAECYYQSVTNLYQGMVFGEPLSAPFAQPASGAWTNLAGNAVLSGTTNLGVQFIASDAWHPVQQVDLFVDGVFQQTVTNLAPQSGNVLSVTLNGFATNYTVPTNATIASVTAGLAAVLNAAAYSNNTKVAAYLHGDRIELQSTATNTRTGSQISLSVGSTNFNFSGMLDTFIHASPACPSNFLDSIATGYNSYEIFGTPQSTNPSLTLLAFETNNTAITVTVTNNSTTNDIETLAAELVNAVNSSPALQGPNGLTIQDYYEVSPSEVVFNIYANSPGYAASQIKAQIYSSLYALTGISIYPGGSNTLSTNFHDLRPRNHLYVTAGVTNLSLTVPFKSTNFPDGWHELAAVAYEGSSVRTQARATQEIVIQNTALTATLTPLLTGTNSALQPTLQFAVTASPPGISSIKLFSTGGLIGATSNQSSSTFTIAPASLDVGAHPFYALVTDTAGHQYRTQTETVGLVGIGYGGTNLFGVDLPFPLQVAGTLPPAFTWPATAGRTYTILSTTNAVTTPFQVEAVLVPTNSVGQWTETNALATQQFYQVRVAP